MRQGLVAFHFYMYAAGVIPFCVALVHSYIAVRVSPRWVYIRCGAKGDEALEWTGRCVMIEGPIEVGYIREMGLACPHRFFFFSRSRFLG